MQIVEQQRHRIAADLILEFLATRQSERTQSAYETDLRQFALVIGCRGRLRLKDVQRIRPEHIVAYSRLLQEQGLAPATVVRKLHALSSFFAWAVDAGYLEQSPYRKSLVPRPQLPRHRMVVTLSMEEARRLVEAARTDDRTGVRDAIMIEVLLYCWLRRSELVAMDVEHIHRRGKHYVLELPSPKGGAADLIKIDGALVEGIYAYLEHYGFEASGPVWRSLSNNSRGRRLTPHGVYHVIVRAVERSGLYRRISPHTLRHTGITLAVERGAPLERVQRHARHRHIDTTMRYVHLQDLLENCPADLLR